MTRPSRWPTVCELEGCDRPSRRPHHHHAHKGFVLPLACECPHVDRAGTAPTRHESEVDAGLVAK